MLNHRARRNFSFSVCETSSQPRMGKETNQIYNLSGIECGHLFLLTLCHIPLASKRTQMQFLFNLSFQNVISSMLIYSKVNFYLSFIMSRFSIFTPPAKPDVVRCRISNRTWARGRAIIHRHNYRHRNSNFIGVTSYASCASVTELHRHQVDVLCGTIFRVVLFRSVSAHRINVNSNHVIILSCPQYLPALFGHSFVSLFLFRFLSFLSEILLFRFVRSFGLAAKKKPYHIAHGLRTETSIPNV